MKLDFQMFVVDILYYYLFDFLLSLHSKFNPENIHHRITFHNSQLRSILMKSRYI